MKSIISPSDPVVLDPGNGIILCNGRLGKSHHILMNFIRNESIIFPILRRLPFGDTILQVLLSGPIPIS
jgi:hypothetical protein